MYLVAASVLFTYYLFPLLSSFSEWVYDAEKRLLPRRLNFIVFLTWVVGVLWICFMLVVFFRKHARDRYRPTSHGRKRK